MTMGGDWGKFINAIGPDFDRRLVEASRVELNRVGRTAVRVARNMIRSRQYAKNAQMTIDLKKSSTPLVATNEMVNRMRHQLEQGRAMGVLMGTNRTDDRGGNIAKKLHEGVRRKGGGGWFIPPRPFLTRPANDPEVQKALREAGMRAVRKAVQGATK